MVIGGDRSSGGRGGGGGGAVVVEDRGYALKNFKKKESNFFYDSVSVALLFD